MIDLFPILIIINIMGINHISEEVDEMDNELTQTELDKVLNLPSDEKAKYATLRGEGL